MKDLERLVIEAVSKARAVPIRQVRKTHARDVALLWRWVRSNDRLEDMSAPDVRTLLHGEAELLASHSSSAVPNNTPPGGSPSYHRTMHLLRRIGEDCAHVIEELKSGSFVGDELTLVEMRIGGTETTVRDVRRTIDNAF